MSVRKIELRLDLGKTKREALRYVNNHPEVTLGNFLQV